ncbi:MAG: tetratricopeptide repeat protein, partial [Planctomycetota bacterium]|nr:tetratricopeptide repeat protein [Planctomycetota bacterium]
MLAVLNNRYVLRELLGRGAMGAVFLAEDRQRGGALCALKALHRWRQSQASPGPVPPQAGPSAPAGRRDAPSAQQPTHPYQVADSDGPGKGSAADRLASFKREFLVLAGLRHPNLAVVHDFGEVAGVEFPGGVHSALTPSLSQGEKAGRGGAETNAASTDMPVAGMPFYTMEFVPGSDLLTATENASFERIAEFFAQVCAGLEFIHGNGILHRDLKPGNIRVTTTPGVSGGTSVVKILDFGMMGGLSPNETPERRGTVAYMPPEVLRGLPVDARSDLYSLGVVLYQVLARRLPFAADSPYELIKKHLEEAPVPPSNLRPGVPQDLSLLAVRLLSKEPARRPGDAAGVAGELLQAYPQSGSAAVAKELRGRVFSSQLIGRDNVLDSLQHAFDTIVWPALSRQAASSGAGPAGSVALVRPHAGRIAGNGTATGAICSVGLVSGTSGTGKKRVVEEFRSRVQVTGAWTLTASFSEASGLPFGGFASLVRQAVDVAGRNAEEVAKYLPDLSLVLPELGESWDDHAAGGFSGRAGSDGRGSRSQAGAVKPGNGGGLDEPSGPLGPPVPFGRMRARLVNRIVNFFLELAERFPMVLFLYDAHRMTPLEAEMLAFLARRLKNVLPGGGARVPPVMVVATYLSDGAVDEDVKQHLDRMVSEGDAAEHRLGPLSETEVGQLLSSALRLKHVPRELLSAVVRGSGGIPLLVEEIAMCLVEDGAIRLETGEWKCDLGRIPQFPGQVGLADLAAQRIEKFSPEEIHIAETLSAFSGAVPPSVVLRAAGCAADGAETFSWENALRDLGTKVIVRFEHMCSSADQKCGACFESVLVSFVHRRLKDLVYNRLNLARRMRLHDAIARALEDHQFEAARSAEDGNRLVGPGTASAGTGAAQRSKEPAHEGGQDVWRTGKSGIFGESIGLHLMKGSTPIRALPYLLREAEQCRRSFANEKALELFSAALALTAVDDHRAKLDIHSAMAGLETLLCRYDDAIRSHANAMRMVFALRSVRCGDDASNRPSCADDPSWHGTAASTLAGAVDTYLRMGAWDKAGAAADRGLAHLAAIGRGGAPGPVAMESGSRMRVRLLFSKAWLASQRARCTESVSYAREALPLAEQLGDPDMKGAIHNVLGIANIYGGDFTDAAKNLKQAIALREAAGNMQGLCDSLNNMSILHSYAGELEGALSEQERILGLRREMGDLWGEVLALSNIGVMYDESGDTRRALEFFLKSLEMRCIAGMEHGFANSLLNVGSARLKLGQYTEAFSCWNRALKIYSEKGDIQGQISVLTNLGDYHRVMGSLDQAALMVSRGLDMARAAGLKPEEIELLRVQATIMDAQFRTEDAMSSVARAFELATDMGARAEAVRSRLEMARLLANANSLDKAAAVAREIVLNRHNVSMTDVMAQGYAVLARAATGKEAKRAAEEAILLASESGLADTQCEALHRLGVMLAEEGDKVEAGAKFSAALDTLASLLENVPPESSTSFLQAPRWARLIESAAAQPEELVKVPDTLEAVLRTARDCDRAAREAASE